MRRGAGPWSDAFRAALPETRSSGSPCIALHDIGARLAARHVPTFRSAIVQVNPMSAP